MRLANKAAIITGGGTGIGKASSLLFAREGARVVIAQRTVSAVCGVLLFGFGLKFVWDAGVTLVQWS